MEYMSEVQCGVCQYSFLGSKVYSDGDKTEGIRVTVLASVRGNSSWQVE